MIKFFGVAAVGVGGGREFDGPDAGGSAGDGSAGGGESEWKQWAFLTNFHAQRTCFRHSDGGS